MWVIKDNGASWDGIYYRDRILAEEVIPFLSNPENVSDPTDVVYLHDNAPCHTKQIPLNNCSKTLESNSLTEQNGQVVLRI